MDVNEILKALETEDIDAILSYADMQGIYTDKEIADKSDEILSRIMRKIEAGDYNYFLSKVNDNSISDIELMLMCKASNKDDIKRLIERKKELKIKTYQLVQLIKATEDLEFIRPFIEDEKMSQELGLYFNATELILATKNPEYIKNSIENKIIIPNTHINYLTLLENLGDEEYTKSIIEDPDKRDSMELSRITTLQLIQTFNDSKYIETIIKDKEKQSSLGIEELTYDEIIQLLISIKDTEYLKKVIENKEKQRELNLTISHTVLIDLIKSTNDPEYIKNIIEDREKQEKLGIKLESYDILYLIKETGSPEYIKSIIEDKEKQKKLGIEKLVSNALIGLIIRTRNVKFIKSLLDDKQKREKIGLSDNDVLPILGYIRDKEYLQDYLKNNIPEWSNENISSSTISLPTNITIGIEIESEGINSVLIKRLTDIIHKKWGCKR